MTEPESPEVDETAEDRARAQAALDRGHEAFNERIRERDRQRGWRKEGKP